jgi:septal ring-binding cell division protein DamX
MGKKIQETLPGGTRSTSGTLHPRHIHSSISMTQILSGICVLTLAVLLSACSASTNNSTPTPTTVIGQINLPAPTGTPAPTIEQQSAATLDPFDPCQLIDSQEASTFTGATFGPGEESTTSGGGKICTYGANTTNVFMVEVAQAPDVATAKADKADFLAMLQASAQELASGGLNVTELPAFADGATLGLLNINYGGITINGSAIGVLKGTIFFGFSDVVKGNAAPTSAAVQAEATTLLGRLP